MTENIRLTLKDFDLKFLELHGLIEEARAAGNVQEYATQVMYLSRLMRQELNAIYGQDQGAFAVTMNGLGKKLFLFPSDREQLQRGEGIERRVNSLDDQGLVHSIDASEYSKVCVDPGVGYVKYRGGEVISASVVKEEPKSKIQVYSPYQIQINYWPIDSFLV